MDLGRVYIHGLGWVQITIFFGKSLIKAVENLHILCTARLLRHNSTQLKLYKSFVLFECGKIHMHRVYICVTCK